MEFEVVAPLPQIVWAFAALLESCIVPATLLSVPSAGVAVKAGVAPASTCPAAPVIEIAGVVPPEEAMGAVPVTLVTVPLPPPPPPALAEAVDSIMLTVVVPLTREDIRIRRWVYPAVFTCHVPVLVVEVAAVVLLLGVAFSATQVVPPSPEASNWMVLAEAFAVTVKVAPPCPGSTLTRRQEVLVVVHVVAAALRTCFC